MGRVSGVLGAARVILGAAPAGYKSQGDEEVVRRWEVRLEMGGPARSAGGQDFSFRHRAAAANELEAVSPTTEWPCPD